MEGLKRVYVFDSVSGFDDVLKKYIDAHHNWKYAKDNNLKEFEKCEEVRQNAAVELAEFCMFHLCVIPYIDRSDVLVLKDLKNNMNALRTCLEKL